MVDLVCNGGEKSRLSEPNVLNGLRSYSTETTQKPNKASQLFQLPISFLATSILLPI